MIADAGTTTFRLFRLVWFSLDCRKSRQHTTINYIGLAFDYYHLVVELVLVRWLSSMNR
jgi:hypothetical protein